MAALFWGHFFKAFSISEFAGFKNINMSICKKKLASSGEGVKVLADRLAKNANFFYVLPY